MATESHQTVWSTSEDESVNVCGQSVYLLKIIPILYVQQLSITQKCAKAATFHLTRLVEGLQTLFVSVPVLSLFFTLVWDLIQMNRTQVQCQAVMFVRNRREVCVCVVSLRCAPNHGMSFLASASRLSGSMAEWGHTNALIKVMRLCLLAVVLMSVKSSCVVATLWIDSAWEYFTSYYSRRKPYWVGRLTCRGFNIWWQTKSIIKSNLLKPILTHLLNETRDVNESGRYRVKNTPGRLLRRLILLTTFINS